MSPECKDLIDKLLELEFKKRLGHRGAGERGLGKCRMQAGEVRGWMGEVCAKGFGCSGVRGR